MSQSWIPGISAARSYQRSWLGSDIVAGIVLATILVPQGMAYAELAGVPAVNGLYTTVVCLLAYAVFGPSRILVLGPDSSVSPLIFAAITPLIVTDDPASAVTLAAMLAILVGLIEVGLGVAKLGFVADLLSSEVRVGYLNGLAVTIIVGQIPKLCGFSVDADSFGEEVREVIGGLPDADPTTVVVGLTVLAVLLVLPRLTRRVPAVLALVLAFNDLLSALPQTALAAVVIGAALSLLDLKALGRYARVRKSALVLSLVATAGVMILGVLEGILVAIVLAILLFFRRNWWPHGEVLGEDEEVGGWHGLTMDPRAREASGIVVFRWEAPLFFANCNQFRDQVRALVREKSPSWVVLQCEAITDIDVTAGEMLRDLDEELNSAGIHMAFAELRTRLHTLVLRYGLFETLDHEHFYTSLEEALAAVRSDLATWVD